MPSVMLKANATKFTLPRLSIKGLVTSIILCTVVLIITVVITAVSNIARERETAYANAFKALELGVVLDEVRVRSLLASLDNIMLMLRDKSQFIGPVPQKKILDGQLHELILLYGNKLRVTVTDEKGEVVASTKKELIAPVNLSDREYFIFQRMADTDHLHVGLPVSSRFDGQLSLPIARRINKTNGTFGGLIVIGVDPELFSGSAESSLVQRDVSRALFGLDGYSRQILVNGKMSYGEDVRKAQVYEEIKKKRSGSYTADASYDGISRLVSYRVLDPYGVVLSAAIDTSVIDANYALDVRRTVIASGVLCLLILTLSAALILGGIRKKRMQDSEIKFDQLIEQIPQMVLKLNLQGAIIWTSKRTYQYVGIAEFDIQPNFDWVLAAVHPDDLETVKAFNSSADKHAKAHDVLEHRMRCSDGEYRWVSASLSLVSGVNGEPKFFLKTVMDVHDQKMTDQQVKQGQKLESIGQLTGGIAHDFNNLLAIVIGNLDLVQSEKQSEQSEQFLKVASAAAQRGVSLVKSLLAVASRLPLLPTVIDLRAVIDRISPLLRNALGPRIGFDIRLPRESCHALLDEAGLESVLLNLIINASDAMPNGGNLNLCLALADGMACISIQDTGTGMSEAVLERATEPYFSTKDADRSSGLGLSMVMGFAKQSGGTLSIQSKEGLGTSIFVSLPLAARPAQTVDLGAVLPVPPFAMSGSLKILIVDDEAAISELLRIWAKAAGFTAVLANSADDALRLLSISAFDVLLSDIKMPGELDGIALAERVSSMYPDMKIMLMSGYSKETATNRINLPWPLLVKPFPRAGFLAAMDQVSRSTGVSPLV
jgi:PAS domain S-box-containing protein